MSLERKLKAAWHKGRALIHLRGLAQLVAWALAGFLFAFFADWLFDLPPLVRLPLVLAILGFVGWWLYREWWARLQRYDPLATAVEVERSYPQLNSLLISYVELSDHDRPRASGSNELMGIVRDQAQEAAGGLDFRSIVSFATLRRLLAVTLGVVLLFGACSAVFTEHMLVAAQRLVGLDTAYPTKTRFGETTGDLLVRRGDHVSLSAQVAGQVPLRGMLYVRPLEDEDADWQRFELDRQEEGRFTHVLPQLSSSLAFRFQIGDASSHRRDEHGVIEVVGPPEIDRVAVAITPPEYTGAGTSTVADLSFEAPEGAAVTIDLALSTPVVGATLVFEHGQELPLTLSADGAIARGELIASTSASYFVRWELTARAREFSFDGTPRRLVVQPDRAPVVTIRQPVGELVATVNKLLELEFEAKDDYGLAALAVIYRVNGGDEFTLDLPPLVKPADQQHLAHPRFGVWPLSWRMRDELPYLKPGDELTLQLEVRDVHAATAEPRIGRSQELRVRILSLLDYQQYVSEQFAEIQNRIAELKAKQQPIEVEVEALKTKIER